MVARISASVVEHATRDSCWIVVHNKAYDVTDFLDEHPGGSKIILKYAGKDATEAYELIHPPDAITTNLPIDKHIVVIDPATFVKAVKEVTEADKRREALIDARPPLDEVLKLHDFEAVAKSGMSMLVLFAIHLLTGCAECGSGPGSYGMSPRWIGPQRSLARNLSLPVYISATALGKLGHPDGELILTRAAGKHGVIWQMLPTLASCSVDEMVDASLSGQPLFLELYVNRDRQVTRKYVQHVQKRGVKALFITVDAPQLGRREKDMRMKFIDDNVGAKVQEGQSGIKKNEGVARAISSFIDPSLSEVSQACRSSSRHCLEQPWGRQLDTSRSGLENFIDIVAALKKRGIWRNPNFSVFVDGGDNDLTSGIEKDEFEMNARLLGARHLGELVPETMDASALHAHVGLTPNDNLYTSTYQPLRLAESRKSKL
ncbi:putative cytochrome b5 family protein [Lyophyllum shimeji]|uniref:Cytochrome b5 family protein n=1 Tax=Lyophyllum shimeji TaxID=47721 RepID=A0A9P3PKR3_LYOSH|nr:putative cytochrome b5 family protein [Lyophyllum shimeji]